jgi:hypothetical protein
VAEVAAFGLDASPWSGTATTFRPALDWRGSLVAATPDTETPIPKQRRPSRDSLSNSIPLRGDFATSSLPEIDSGHHHC